MVSRGNRTLGRFGALVLLCLALGACAGGASGPPTIGLSILAPTSGSTVGVRALQLVGHVTPASAMVTVGHRTVRVRKGVFKQPLILLAPLTHISISARAAGFRGASTVIAVRYSPKLFRHRPAGRPHRVSGPSKASIARGVQSAENQLTGPDFVDGCTHWNPALMPYCTCVWSRIKAAGLDTAAQWRALAAQWRRTFLSQGVIAYPPAMRNAALSCIGRLHLP